MTNESKPPFTDLTDALLSLLKASPGVLVGTHLNPDGDAIGSALALALWLEKAGIPSQVLCHHEVPSYLAFLPASQRVRKTAEGVDEWTGLVVDLDSMDRLGSCRPYFEGKRHLVLIDHHVPHEMPGHLRIVDPSAPATASILCDILAVAEEAGWPPVDSEIAECLLTGIVTDTGSFRYPNSTANVLHQAAWLQERGGSVSRVANQVYMNRDEPAVRLLGDALHGMKTACGGRLAWAVLPAALYERLGAKEEHSEGIVNEILSIRTVQAAFVLRQGLHGNVKGSLRSKGDLDVATVAQSLGGGGHRNAAGVTVHGTLEEAETILVEALSQCLASCS